MNMIEVQGWEDSDGGSHVLRGDRLLPATDEALDEAAHHAMLLSQGAERAIQMRGDELTSSVSERGLHRP
jgi:hypothetical protein